MIVCDDDDDIGKKTSKNRENPGGINDRLIYSETLIGEKDYKKIIRYVDPLAPGRVDYESINTFMVFEDRISRLTGGYRVATIFIVGDVFGVRPKDYHYLLKNLNTILKRDDILGAIYKLELSERYIWSVRVVLFFKIDIDIESLLGIVIKEIDKYINLDYDYFYVECDIYPNAVVDMKTRYQIQKYIGSVTTMSVLEVDYYRIYNEQSYTTILENDISKEITYTEKEITPIFKVIGLSNGETREFDIFKNEMNKGSIVLYMSMLSECFFKMIFPLLSVKGKRPVFDNDIITLKKTYIDRYRGMVDEMVIRLDDSVVSCSIGLTYDYIHLKFHVTNTQLSENDVFYDELSIEYMNNLLIGIQDISPRVYFKLETVTQFINDEITAILEASKLNHDETDNPLDLPVDTSVFYLS